MADDQPSSSTGPAKDYEYQTISPEEIRLLTLAPSSSSTTKIEVLIHHCKRADNPGYGAISYTWGDEDASHSIYCDGSIIKVTKGCEEALRALRHHELPRNLWIDAVCINQGDIEERTQQVARMGEVYLSANETFAYLGQAQRSYDIYHPKMTVEDTEWIALLERPWFRRTWVIQELMLSKRMTLVIGRQMLALSDLLSLCAMREIKLPNLLKMRTDFVHDYARQPPKSWDETQGSNADDSLDMHGALPPDYDTVEASKKSRKSIRDAKRLAVSYTARGIKRFSPGEMWSHPRWPLVPGAKTRSNDQVVRTLNKGKQPIRDEKKPAEDTRAPTQEDSRLRKGSGRTDLNYWMLHDVLRLTVDFGCRDPRDRRFAILPLFRRPIPALLYPNYKKSTQEVFADLAWFLLQHDVPQSLEYAGGSNDEGMPSWVTDWSRGVPRRSFEDETAVTQEISRWRKAWRAGFQPGARESRSSRIDSTTISLRGVTVGEVSLTQRKQCYSLDLDTKEGRQSHSVTLVLRQASEGHCEFHCKVWRDRHKDAEGAFLDQVEERVLQLSGQTRESDINIQRRRDSGKLKGNPIQWSVLHVSGCFERSELIFTIIGEEICGQSTGSQDDTVSKINHPRDFVGAITPFTSGRCAIRSDAGEWGLAPEATRPGDCVCILLGFKMPFVLRREGSQWILIGECFMDEIVNGHPAVDAIDQSNLWSNTCPAPLENYLLG